MVLWSSVNVDTFYDQDICQGKEATAFLTKSGLVRELDDLKKVILFRFYLKKTIQLLTTLLQLQLLVSITQLTIPSKSVCSSISWAKFCCILSLLIFVELGFLVSHFFSGHTKCSNVAHVPHVYFSTQIDSFTINRHWRVDIDGKGLLTLRVMHRPCRRVQKGVSYFTDQYIFQSVPTQDMLRVAHRAKGFQGTPILWSTVISCNKAIWFNDDGKWCGSDVNHNPQRWDAATSVNKKNISSAGGNPYHLPCTYLLICWHCTPYPIKWSYNVKQEISFQPFHVAIHLIT